MASVDEEIGMAVADAGVANGKSFEPQLINHPARGPARRVLEDAAGALLAERLARTPLFVADTNPLKNFFVRFGGKFQLHREHHIIRRKRSVTVFKGNLLAPEDFYLAGGGAVQLDLADVGADLHSIGAGVHAQGAADGAWDSDEAFHAAKVVLGAVGDGAAEVRGRVDLREIAFYDHVRIGRRELQDDPGKFAVA